MYSSLFQITCICALLTITKCEINNQSMDRGIQHQVRLNSIPYRPDPKPTEPLKQRETFIQPTIRDRIRVTLNEPTTRVFKLDHLLDALDRVAYVLTKPATIINALRFLSIALTSFFMSVFMPLGSDQSRKRYRAKTLRYNLFGSITRADVEGMIEMMTRNYDETLNQAGFNDRSPCRERSLCVLGDMVACDFPSVVVSIGKFAQNHLPPVDMYKNKYTKAIMFGMNQTNCDHAYKTDPYECPSFREYVKSYFYVGVKKRRDNHNWWRGWN